MHFLRSYYIKLKQGFTRSFFILTIKANNIHYFKTFSWPRTLHVSDRLTVHHQES